MATERETLGSRLTEALVLTLLVRLRRKTASRSRGVTERLQLEVTCMRYITSVARMHYLPEVAEPALVVRLT
jgi:hypothetical protein